MIQRKQIRKIIQCLNRDGILKYDSLISLRDDVIKDIKDIIYESLSDSCRDIIRRFPDDVYYYSEIRFVESIPYLSISNENILIYRKISFGNFLDLKDNILDPYRRSLFDVNIKDYKIPVMGNNSSTILTFSKFSEDYDKDWKEKISPKVISIFDEWKDCYKKLLHIIRILRNEDTTLTRLKINYPRLYKYIKE